MQTLRGLILMAIRSRSQSRTDMSLTLLTGVFGATGALGILIAIAVALGNTTGLHREQAVVLISGGVGIVGRGASALLFNGIWRLRFELRQERMDVIFCRPYPVLFQVLSSDSNLGAIPLILSGLTAVSLGLHKLTPSPDQYIQVAAVLVCGAVMAFSASTCISVAANTLAFFGRGPGNEIATGIVLLADVLRFPPSVFAMAGVGGMYPGFLALPFGYGAARAAETGSGEILLTTVASTAGWIVIATVLWNSGLRRFRRRG